MDARTPVTPPKAPKGTTPVMEQYFAAKAKHEHALLLFRMGDFYELFFEDAVVAAECLGIALTKRGKNGGEDIPMAGVPVHALEGYLPRLIKAGHTVAVCEQLETPAEAKKRGYKAVVKRDVVRVITPGTITDDGLLEAKGTKRLISVFTHHGHYAIAGADVSTGELLVEMTSAHTFQAQLAAMAPAEILVCDHLQNDDMLKAALAVIDVPTQARPRIKADATSANAQLCRLFGVKNLDAFGDFSTTELSALGVLIDYIALTQPGEDVRLLPPKQLKHHEHMVIDATTRASLELSQTQSGEHKGSLLHTLDRTVTGAGGRMLADWLARPLMDLDAITSRLDAVQFALDNAELRQTLRGALKQSGDMARAVTRLGLNRGGPRDLGVILNGLKAAEHITEHLLLQSMPSILAEIASHISHTKNQELAAVFATLESQLGDDLPTLTRDGGFIKKGADATLDELRDLQSNSRQIIASLQSELQSQTGLSTLKIKNNNVLGFFIDVSAKQADVLMTERWQGTFIHRQTLANQVRFTTTELTELDAKITRAADMALAREQDLFTAMVADIKTANGAIHRAATALATLDVVLALAEWAAGTNATRPTLDTSKQFNVHAARHPVVEAHLKRERTEFIANDCTLDGDGLNGPRLALITGPNMAGKSTYLRQNALLTILAQIGSFVPAQSAHIGIVDRVFSRVGAADDLARGRSTFMTEMVEVASILNQATDRSLVILDEIGRGTATYDGLAIAWSTAEAMHNTNQSRTLFATHYHELSQLDHDLQACQNLHLQAKEWKGDLVFMHTVATGTADRSYGVQVAKLAGVPRPVVQRAKTILTRLEAENSHTNPANLPLFSTPDPADEVDDNPVLDELDTLDPDSLSPKQALDMLYTLKRLHDDRNQ